MSKVLQDLTTETHEQIIARLTAENQSLKASTPFKVSPKGAVSVYGMGQWPVTLYASQWEKIFAMEPALKAFMKEHAGKLAVKEKKVA